MSVLFSTVRIRSLELKNRFVRSATYDGMADRKGMVTDDQLTLYTNLARGGVGLIISGIAYVLRNGRISPTQNSIVDDEAIPGLKRLVNEVHNYGCRIALQLFHAGREVGKFRPDRAWGPSFVEDDKYFTANYQTMTENEIGDVIQAFGDGALRAKEAGFDAVQVHGAHAYLVSQFLSPYANRRTDAWGGSLENRLRFHTEILRDIRSKVGDDYPVMIKLGAADGFPEGLAADQGIMAAKTLADAGYDCLEISQGLRGNSYKESEFRTNVETSGGEAYFRDWAAQVKSRVDVPVMMVGGLRSPDLMETVINNGEADFVSICRPLIREPDLIEAWRKGDRRRPACISCNKCFDRILEGKPLACALEIDMEQNLPD